jgi:hypothetical protein
MSTLVAGMQHRRYPAVNLSRLPQPANARAPISTTPKAGTS